MRARIAIPVLLATFCLGGCGLPYFPTQVTMKPPPQTFTGPNHCRVRVESYAFDPAVRLGDRSEAQWVESLKPEQRQSYANDKAAATAAFMENLGVNEKDYVGSRGRVVGASQGDEPLVVRSRVMLFDPKEGDLIAVHELFQTSDQSKLGEVRISAKVNSWYGSGFNMRAASIGQAFSLLKYFGDRFACNGPPRVAD